MLHPTSGPNMLFVSRVPKVPAMHSDPHILIGRHPDLGVMAINRHNNAVIDHVLRRVGFEPAVGRRQLYTLTEPDHDPMRRARQAVKSLRNGPYEVATDAEFEPGTTPPRPSQEQARHHAEADRQAHAATAVSPARSAIRLPDGFGPHAPASQSLTADPVAGLRSPSAPHSR